MVVSVCLGGYTIGYESGISCGTLIFIDTDYPEITIQQKSNFVSFLVIGGIFGAIIAGSVSEKIGRKISIILSLLIMIAATIVLTIGNDIELLCASRLLQGFGMGLNMMVSQVYLSESTPKQVRGAAIQSYVLIVFVGFICSHISSMINAYQLKLMFSLGLIPALLSLFMFIITQQESPTYVAQKGSPEQVYSIIRRFYKLNQLSAKASIDIHYHEIMDQVKKNSGNSDKSQAQLYKELFTTYRWNLIVAVTLHFLQNLTGFNIIQNFGPSILKDAGMSGDSYQGLLLSMTFLTSVIFISNAIGIKLSTKYGRRQMMLMTCIPMGLSLLMLDGALLLTISSDGQSKGFVSVPWLVQTEIFPIHLIGFSNAIATTSNWFFNSMLLSIFLQITKTETGKIVAYTILAAVCFITHIFVFRYLPETKDKSLDICVQLVLDTKQYGITKANQISNGDSVNTKNTDFENQKDDTKQGLLGKNNQIQLAQTQNKTHTNQ
eukprot:403363238